MAALKCRTRIEGLNQARKEKGLPEFPTRFGIHCGLAIVGNIGTEERMNYTVIGDVVNTTSRLKDVDKVYHTSILISEQVYAQVKEQFWVRPIDVVAVKGRKEKTKIYELMAIKQGDHDLLMSANLAALSVAFTEAYEALERQEIQRAKGLFQEILRKHPDDVPTQIYLERIENLLRIK